MPRVEREDDGITLDLVHPMYLDVPMLVSFLAALQGGISFENEVTERLLTGQERQGGVSTKLGLPNLSSLLGMRGEAHGEYRRQSRGEKQQETRIVRQHTEASLFNLLRFQLMQSKRIQIICTSDDLEKAKPGELVESRVRSSVTRLFEFLISYMHSPPSLASI